MTEVCIQVSSTMEPKAKTFHIDRKTVCDHWFFCDEICCNCKATMNKSKARSFGYLVSSLQLSHEAVAFIKRKRSEHYLGKKKLHLVLDLDHTLLHSLKVSELSGAERYLVREAESRDDLWRINLGDSTNFLTKLRPFVREFLREASELYSMYVYTMGSPRYAETVVKLLDPGGDYFGRRVITRRDSANDTKSLDLVLAEDRHVVIVDDIKEVWPDHGGNLIEIKGYDYFREKGRCRWSQRSYAEKRSDEGERDGPLAKVLEKLKKLHRDIFDEACDDKFCLRDVRPLLRP